MINLTKHIWLAFLVAILVTACTQGSNSTLDDLEKKNDGLNLFQNSPQLGSAVIKSLVTCPADSYKFIEHKTLVDETPLANAAVQDNLCTKPKASSEALPAVEAKGNELIITRKDNTSVTCTFTNPITDFVIGHELTRDIVALSTQGSFAFAYVNSINAAEKDKICDKFKDIEMLGGFVAVATASSKDNTLSVEKAGQPPADIQLSTSINLLPSGYRFGADMKEILSDYIYLLSPENKVVRIKPSAISGGCTEVVWTTGEGMEPAKTIAIESGELKIYGTSGTLIATVGL